MQVLSSVAAGAEYVAPYVGRMTDSGVDGVATVAAMNKVRRSEPPAARDESGWQCCSAARPTTWYGAQIVAASGSRTRVLVASIRSAEVMAELAAAGCDTFTISPEVQH
jgi:transaldolase